MWLRSASCPFDYSFHSDTVYNDLYENIFNATTIEGVKELVTKADMHALSQHWGVYVCSQVAGYYVWQPWVKGYNGEGGPPPPGGAPTGGWLLARSWIDPGLKK